MKSLWPLGYVISLGGLLLMRIAAEWQPKADGSGGLSEALAAGIVGIGFVGVVVATILLPTQYRTSGSTA